MRTQESLFPKKRSLPEITMRTQESLFQKKHSLPEITMRTQESLFLKKRSLPEITLRAQESLLPDTLSYTHCQLFLILTVILEFFLNTVV